MQRDPPLVKMLPRQPGTKETRYIHLLGDMEIPEPQTPEPANSDSADRDRIARIEAEVESPKTEINELRKDFREFQKRFE